MKYTLIGIGGFVAGIAMISMWISSLDVPGKKIEQERSLLLDSIDHIKAQDQLYYASELECYELEARDSRLTKERDLQELSLYRAKSNEYKSKYERARRNRQSNQNEIFSRPLPTDHDVMAYHHRLSAWLRGSDPRDPI